MNLLQDLPILVSYIKLVVEEIKFIKREVGNRSLLLTIFSINWFISNCQMLSKLLFWSIFIIKNIRKWYNLYLDTLKRTILIIGDNYKVFSKISISYEDWSIYCTYFWKIYRINMKITKKIITHYRLFGTLINGFSIGMLVLSLLTPKVYLITSSTSNLVSLEKVFSLGGSIVPVITDVGKELLCEKALYFAECAIAARFLEF